VATIINTLEVVVDQPSPGAAAAPPTSPPKPPAPPLTPRDLDDVFARQVRNLLRVAAH
jgi:hypothetical protein